MNKMHTAKGLVVIEAAGEEFPPDAYFDFVECFGLALLSMGALTVERTRKPVARVDTDRDKSMFAANVCRSSVLDGDR